MNGERAFSDHYFQEAELREIAVPYTRIPFAVEGQNVYKGLSGNGVNNDITVELFDQSPLGYKTLDVLAEMSAICQTESSEDARRLKLLELDLILLQAQTDIVQAESLAEIGGIEVVQATVESVHKAVENGYSSVVREDFLEKSLELTEDRIADKYDALSQEPGFVEWFTMQLDEKVDKNFSKAEILAAELDIFDELINNNFDNDERENLIELAREITEEIELQKQIVEIAVELAVPAVNRIEENAVAFDEAQSLLQLSR